VPAGADFGDEPPHAPSVSAMVAATAIPAIEERRDRFMRKTPTWWNR
jgi:hypothetical protein